LHLALPCRNNPVRALTGANLPLDPRIGKKRVNQASGGSQRRFSRPRYMGSSACRWRYYLVSVAPNDALPPAKLRDFSALSASGQLNI
jgi:hypothetical protein